MEGIRIGDWKLLMKQPKGKKDGDLAKSEVMLFDLAGDIGERSNLAAANPEIVERLRLRMIELDAGIAAAARPVWQKP